MAGHIFIYGGIGTDKREREISFDDVRQQIEQNKSESELIVHIISNGGDVFEGEAIYNALKNTGKKITTHIEGTCASIATLIAGAGSTIIMNKNARFMIHNPKISGLGASADARDLRHVAAQLDQIKTLLINVYDVKTSLGKEKLWELYDNETWLTADQAQQMGFIDESVDAIKAVAKVDLTKIKIMAKENSVLNKLINMFTLKLKNEFTETLEDGTVIIVMSEDEDWTGKQVIYEDGSPLPDGDHALASGKVISVASGLISEVKEAPSAEENQNEDMQNRIKELEAQLAEATAARDQALAQAKTNETKATEATNKAIKFENRLGIIEKDFLKLKEEAGKTQGDTTDPAIAVRPVNQTNKKGGDPMGDFALDFYRNRNLVK